MTIVAVDIAFLGTTFDQVADPDTALRSLIGHIGRAARAGRDRSRARSRRGGDAAAYRDRRCRGPGGVRGECSRSVGARSTERAGWLFCRAGLDRPALRDGTRFGVAVPLAAVLPRLFRELALADARFDYRLHLIRANADPAAARACAAALGEATSESRAKSSADGTWAPAPSQACASATMVSEPSGNTVRQVDRFRMPA